MSESNWNRVSMATLSFIAGLFLFVSASGCGDAKKEADASAGLDAPTNQDVPGDASTDGSACPCAASPRDGNGQGGPGNGPSISLSCYCNRYPNDCLSYDQAALSCPFPYGQNGIVKTTYPACNLVEFDELWGGDRTVRVYGLDTHELRAIYHSTDTNKYQCGAGSSMALSAGVFPTCAPSESVRLCPTDAGAVDTSKVD